MNLRPRYSLLSLLVLTALIAGGMQVWRGPHHVIEGIGTDFEEECTFTRTWNSGRILHGPRARRTFSQGILESVKLGYYRQGKHLWRHYYVFVNAGGAIRESELPTRAEQASDNVLTAGEQAEWVEFVERQRQHTEQLKLKIPGHVPPAVQVK